jgi:hypothetical protein
MVVNRFDQASRYLAKLDAEGFLVWLLRLPLEELRFRRWLDTRRLPFPGDPERTCDTVAWLSDADPALEWALVVEFSLEPDTKLFGRLLVYLGQLWEEERPTDASGEHFHVGAAVVNLTGQGRTSRRMKLRRTKVQTFLGVEELNLSKENAATLLEKVASGQLSRCLLPWVPLMKNGEKPKIIKRWLELAQSETNARRRGDYGGLALVFAEAAGRHAVWKEALRGWNMVESKQVLEWIAEGEIKGRIEGEADALLRFLRKRFPPGPSADLESAIRTTTDLQRLRGWIDLAVETDSVDAFRTAAGL